MFAKELYPIIIRRNGIMTTVPFKELKSEDVVLSEPQIICDDDAYVSDDGYEVVSIDGIVCTPDDFIEHAKTAAAFMQCEPDGYLSIADMQYLLAQLDAGKNAGVEMMRVEGNNTIAYGFITETTAARTNFDEQKFSEMVRGILDDVDKESADCRYRFMGVNTKIVYQMGHPVAPDMASIADANWEWACQPESDDTVICCNVAFTPEGGYLEDETSFDVYIGTAVQELEELFHEFCKENHFQLAKDSDITVIVTDSARTMEELEERA